MPTLGIAAFNPNRDLAQRGNPHQLSPIHQESPPETAQPSRCGRLAA